MKIEKVLSFIGLLIVSMFSVFLFGCNLSQQSDFDKSSLGNNKIKNQTGNKQLVKTGDNKEVLGGTGSAQIENPASKYCEEKGGTLKNKKNPNGDEYGVCFFEDNKQCEEWALYKGNCPVGGVKVTGYQDEAQIYCAIIGGDIEYKDDGSIVCKRPDGKACLVKENFESNCQNDKGASDVSNRQEVMNNKAKSLCKKKNIKSVSKCGDYLKAVTKLEGGRLTIYKLNDKLGFDTISCPVDSPESMSEQCKKYILQSNCADINVCDKKSSE